MSKRAMRQPFSSTDPKDFIRHEIDRPIIEEFRDTYYQDESLAYLGLAGSKLLDVLAWREFIGRGSVIERDDYEELEINILKNRLEGALQIVRGDADDVLSLELRRRFLRWPYQIVNLDYYGGLIHRREDGSSSRLDSIKALFQEQRQVAFALFITVNLRDKDLGELDEVVRQQEEDFEGIGLIGVKDTFDAHRSVGNAGFLKIYAPLFLVNIALHHSLVFRPPIAYRGGNQMIHFIVECVPYSELGAGRMVTTRERIDLVNLPFLVLQSAGDLRALDMPRIEMAGSRQ